MNSLDYDDLILETLESPEETTMSERYHEPVLLDEVVALLRPAPGMVILDGTIGGGGHAERLLEAGATIIGLDQDSDALTESGTRLARFASRLHLRKSNFADAAMALDALGISQVAGALIDIGVSSHQLDTAHRGFALMKDGPLDMRMDRDAGLTAANLVNTAAPEELVRILREYGEEQRASQIVARIVAVRQTRPLLTTFDLAATVASVVPRTSGRHPATRTFQALRIAVNDELGLLRRGLEEISSRLAHGARFAVITFHSLEDRIVKHYFRDHGTEWMDRPEWPEPRRNPNRIFRLLTPRPIDAGTEELQVNPRSRSAKLRIVERI